MGCVKKETRDCENPENERIMAKLKNDRWEEFCQQYLIDFNVTRAGKDAGFSEKSAYATCHKLLKNAEIQKRIMELIERRQERTEITQDMVLKELAILAFSDFTDFAEFTEGGEIRIKTFDEMPEGVSRAIKSVQEDRILKEAKDGEEMLIHDKLKYTLHDKITPLVKLGVHTGLTLDRMNLNGKLKLKINGKMRIEDLRESHAKATGK